ncbi:segregation and condensation protein B [Geodermatophilus sp. Leaf369]|uniref:SMC-Scp complex subunit ScpB n=1 Tax=Geodermatophilus sp. Leaf369 TaxID=1736354 RepID=UPI0006F54288|nr:SMC-Scp complex subunit ScpB [Geodermatophilus sp. Leaf369]KQS54798.1 segregation and condensation protein B [Geodermatophilus sp. Leaf369]
MSFSWERIAAELAAAEADDRTGRTADPDAWDAAARALAASLGVPAAPDLPPVPVEAHAAPVRVRPDPDGPPLRPLDEVPVEEADPAAARSPLGVVPDEVDPAELRGGLEALLFVVDTPVDDGTLAATLRCTVGQVRRALLELGADYDARGAGVVLRRVGEGWRLYTREDHAAVVERYLTDGRRARLTQAALETLAVIAYRQPVTRARVSAIRGVGVDAVVRTLASRGLVYECGTDPDSGGGLYATTPLFLERLGLTGLDELPELAPLLPEARTVLDEHPES